MIVLHHNDLDGRASAAILGIHCADEEVRFVEMDYNKEVPFKKIKKGEKVYIVDFSLQKPGDWEKLLSITDEVIWIDHHKTAMQGNGVQHQLPGVREEGRCGALLTWRFLSGLTYRPIPLAIEYINDWDCWIHDMEDTIPFKMGIEMDDTGPTAEVWNRLLNNDPLGDELNDIIQKGKITQKFQNQFYKEYVKSWGFETELQIKGKIYSVFAVNLGRASSLAFGDKLDKYDICVSFIFDGNQYTISLYSSKEHIECGQICKKRGGGGHKSAAGFQCKELPEFLSRRK
jgi:oligoribonuclease NrnB/cAMP/cGMP phosphodiesterase (DHH superfamily)